MSVNPKQPTLKEGGYDSEIASFGDFNNLFRNFATRALRPSRTSPPIANDVDELTAVIDKSTLKIYWKVNGTLRYVQLT